MFPYNKKINNFTYSDLKKIDLSKIDVLVFNSKYNKRFADEKGSIDWEKIRSDWQEVRDFYLKFYNKDFFIDSFGNQWHVSSSYMDGLLVIWEKSTN